LELLSQDALAQDGPLECCDGGVGRSRRAYAVNVLTAVDPVSAVGEALVIPGPAIDDVVPRTLVDGEQFVAAAAALEDVAATAADQRVPASHAVDHIPLPGGMNVIVPTLSTDAIRSRSPGQDVPGRCSDLGAV
jgi:hypothetical protein